MEDCLFLSQKDKRLFVSNSLGQKLFIHYPTCNPLLNCLQCVEQIAMKWISRLLESDKTQSEHMMRILASLHLLCSLHSAQHHMDGMDLINFICLGLDISALDNSNFAQLRQLLEQVYLNENR